MLTTTSNISFFSGYQDQLNVSTKVTGSSYSKNQNESAQNESNDEVTLSRKAKELQRAYAEKETILEQKYKNESNKLEREYLQDKNRVEKEFIQKKQALEINLYA